MKTNGDGRETNCVQTDRQAELLEEELRSKLILIYR